MILSVQNGEVLSLLIFIKLRGMPELEKEKHGRFASLDILATDPAYRRRGVSSVLMEWVQPIENVNG
jgi:GNAT superfamily N-acetyltransferase